MSIPQPCDPTDRAGSIVHWLSTRPILEVIGVFLLGFIFAISINLIFGYGIASGDSRFYISISHVFSEHGWRAFADHKIPFYYRLFPVLLALFEKMSPGNWKTIFMVFQCVMYGFYALGVFKLSVFVFDRAAGWLSVLLLFPLYEVWNWSRYILTDTMFSVLLLWFVLAICELERERMKGITGWLKVSLLLALLLTSRPVGVFAGVGFIAYLLGVLSLRKWGLRRVLIATNIMIPLGILAVALCIALLPEDIRLGQFDFFRKLFYGGIVIHDRSCYDIRFPAWIHGNVAWETTGYFLLAAYRSLMFWNPFVLGYSLVHMMLNGLTVFPIIVAGLCSVFKKIGTHRGVIYSMLITFTVLHSVTLIDFDHRYRTPLMGLLVVLASGMILNTFRSIERRRYPFSEGSE